MEFALHYHCSNGGDGSVSVHFHPNLEAAEKADEEMDEGWGESSAGTVNLKVENNQLFYREYERVDGKYQYIWKPVEQS